MLHTRRRSTISVARLWSESSVIRLNGWRVSVRLPIGADIISNAHTYFHYSIHSFRWYTWCLVRCLLRVFQYFSWLANTNASSPNHGSSISIVQNLHNFVENNSNWFHYIHVIKRCAIMRKDWDARISWSVLCHTTMSFALPSPPFLHNGNHQERRPQFRTSIDKLWIIIIYSYFITCMLLHLIAALHQPQCEWQADRHFPQIAFRKTLRHHFHGDGMAIHIHYIVML